MVKIKFTEFRTFLICNVFGSYKEKPPSNPKIFAFKMRKLSEKGSKNGGFAKQKHTSQRARPEDPQ